MNDFGKTIASKLFCVFFSSLAYITLKWLHNCYLKCSRVKAQVLWHILFDSVWPNEFSERIYAGWVQAAVTIVGFNALMKRFWYFKLGMTYKDEIKSLAWRHGYFIGCDSWSRTGTLTPKLTGLSWHQPWQYGSLWSKCTGTASGVTLYIVSPHHLKSKIKVQGFAHCS